MIWHSDGWSSVLERVPVGLNRAFGLVLNMMRNNTESRTLVCVADNREEIESLLTAERVEQYRDVGVSGFSGDDHTFHKSFRKDGPLEWFNAPGGIYDGTGIIELRRDGWRQVGE